LFPNSVNKNIFVPLLRERLRDIYISSWHENIKYFSSLTLFRDLKPTFKRSSYLDIVTFSKYRKILAKVRLSSHSLNIETGRHKRIDRNQRICTLCNLTELEDEYHFIMICPFYNDIRKHLIPEYYINRPCMFKFIQLLKSDKKNDQYRLASYCIKAFNRRQLKLDDS
jgi:hypothetical protein